MWAQWVDKIIGIIPWLYLIDQSDLNLVDAEDCHS